MPVTHVGFKMIPRGFLLEESSARCAKVNLYEIG